MFDTCPYCNESPKPYTGIDHLDDCYFTQKEKARKQEEAEAAREREALEIDQSHEITPRIDKGTRT